MMKNKIINLLGLIGVLLFVFSMAIIDFGNTSFQRNCVGYISASLSLIFILFYGYKIYIGKKLNIMPSQKITTNLLGIVGTLLTVVAISIFDFDDFALKVNLKAYIFFIVGILIIAIYFYKLYMEQKIKS